MFKKLLSCVREYKLPTLLTLLFIVLEAIIETFIPFLTANLVDNIRQKADISHVITMGLILVGLAVLSLACGGIAGYTCAKASAGFAKNLRHDMFYRIQNYSFENIDKFSSSSLVTRMTTDVTNVQMSYMMIIRIAVRAPLMLIFSIVAAYYMGGALATPFVVIIPIIVVALVLIGKNAMPAFKRVFRKYDKLNESIEENVRGIRVVKGFAREEFEKKKFGVAASDICKDFTKAERIVVLNGPVMQFCIYLNLIFVLILGSYLIVSTGAKMIDVGEMSAMLTYGFQILMNLMMLSMIYVMLTMSSESLKRIGEVLDEESTLNRPQNGKKTVEDGSIVFKDVSFKYSKHAKEYALSNIDLTIKSGMTVGIIGGTGSSKSSLVQLIPRLYDVTTGSILVGGTDVKDYDLTVLRDSVAMVLQKNILFSGTIKENLRWGNENATDKEIIDACKCAKADEFIDTLSDGYDTYIEQGGTNVSGGQKQRLCIARALLKHPKIIIFDDSTSAVDTKTDAKIREELKNTIPDTTKIIIAQRISSVMDSDMIIVMDNGKISAVGDHDKLMKTSDIYREIYEQQTGGAENE